MKDPLFKHVYRLDGLITTVDAVHGEGQLDDHQEAVRQAAVADRVLITKMDLLGDEGAERLRERLHALNPGARVLEARFGQVDPGRLFDTGMFDAETKSLDVRRWLNEEAYAGGDHHDYVALQPNLDQPNQRLYPERAAGDHFRFASIK